MNWLPAQALLRTTLTLLLAMPLALAAQTTAPLETDRPDQTESSNVVPRGTLQWETGVLYEWNDYDPQQPSRGFTIPTNLFRIGVMDNLELRIVTEYREESILNDRQQQVAQTFGINEFDLGAKVKICEEEGLRPQISLNYHVHLPLTNGDYRTTRAASSIRGMFGHTLSDSWDLGYNLGYKFNSDGTPNSFEYTMALGHSFSSKFGFYVELFGEKPDATPLSEQIHGFDGGFKYLPLPNLQFDASAGISYTRWGAYTYAAAGFSLRLPR